MITVIIILLLVFVVYFLFSTKDADQLEDDYETRCFLMPEKEFMTELNKSGYFKTTSNEQSRIIYQLARKYGVEPSQILMRINELK